MTDDHVNPVNPDSGQDDLPEQMRVRREKRDRLLAEGVQPYPISVPRTHLLKDLREKYDGQDLEPDTRTGEQVAVAGRVIFLRNTGKLCFVRLREGDGTELQVMLSLADLGEEELARFKQLVDIGDLLSVQGEVITSRRGELSVQATAWQLAAKTLRPLPNEHKPLNEEARVRLRYVDLIVRPEALRVSGRADRTALRARVLVRRDLGPVHLLRLRLPDGSSVKLRQAGQIEAAIGEEVALELDPRHLFVFPAEA